MKRIVIAEAGPLIALARIDQLGLLPRLFGTVLVTEAIASELSQGGVFPDTDRLVQALAHAWLETASLPNLGDAACLDWMNLHQIDRGEASALVLASHLVAQGDEVLLVVDDTRGRLAAQHARIPITGTAGLLVLAKSQGLVPAVKPLLLALQTQGYFLSERLVQAVLRQSGEA